MYYDSDQEGSGERSWRYEWSNLCVVPGRSSRSKWVKPGEEHDPLRMSPVLHQDLFFDPGWLGSPSRISITKSFTRRERGVYYIKTTVCVTCVHLWWLHEEPCVQLCWLHEEPLDFFFCMKTQVIIQQSKSEHDWNDMMTQPCLLLPLRFIGKPPATWRRICSHLLWLHRNPTLSWHEYFFVAWRLQ